MDSSISITSTPDFSNWVPNVSNITFFTKDKGQYETEKPSFVIYNNLMISFFFQTCSLDFYDSNYNCFSIEVQYKGNIPEIWKYLNIILQLILIIAQIDITTGSKI